MNVERIVLPQSEELLDAQNLPAGVYVMGSVRGVISMVDALTKSNQRIVAVRFNNGPSQVPHAVYPSSEDWDDDRLLAITDIMQEDLSTLGRALAVYDKDSNVIDFLWNDSTEALLGEIGEALGHIPSNWKQMDVSGEANKWVASRKPERTALRRHRKPLSA